MEDSPFFYRLYSHLRATSKYYTDYPKDLGPSRVIPFTSEREFVQILHEGHPVVVAFSIKCPFTRHFEKVLEEAAAKFHPHIKFMRAAAAAAWSHSDNRSLRQHVNRDSSSIMHQQQHQQHAAASVSCNIQDQQPRLRRRPST